MKRFALMVPIAAGIMFGTVGIFVRELTGFGMSNSTILFVRALFAAVMLLVFLLIYNRNLLKIKMKEFPLFLGTGILGMMGLNLCYNNAINSLSLSLSAVLLSSAPVFVVVIAAIIFKEKVTSRKIICIIMVIVGCVFASGLLEVQTGLAVSAKGIMFGVAAAFFYAMYSIFSRLATDREYHTYTVIFYSVLLIAIVLLPIADVGVVTDFVSDDPIKNLLFLCMHGLVTSVLPYMFITLALLHVEAGRVSILASGGEPAAAVIFGILFYGEVPTILMFVGLTITIVALALLCVDKSEKI